MFFKRFKKNPSTSDKGLILVEDVATAMAVERFLKEMGFEVKGVAPPPRLRKGCDLAVEFNLVEQMGIEKALKNTKISFFIAPLRHSEAPVDIVKTKDIDGYILVRAVNMKVVFDKKGVIVNVSGGGCPDVPYLSKNLIGKHLKDAPPVMEMGFSLCAYMLKKAIDRAMEIF